MAVLQIQGVHSVHPSVLRPTPILGCSAFNYRNGKQRLSTTPSRPQNCTSDPAILTLPIMTGAAAGCSSSVLLIGVSDSLGRNGVRPALLDLSRLSDFLSIHLHQSGHDFLLCGIEFEAVKSKDSFIVGFMSF